MSVAHSPVTRGQRDRESGKFKARLLIIMFRRWFQKGPRTPVIDDSVWQACVSQMPFIERLDLEAREHLIDLADRFVEQKDFSGTHGFVITDLVRAAIALQACLPVARLGLDSYSDFVEIIVYPDRFVTPRSRVDEAGVVHESFEELSGETMPGGPVVLAWPDVDPASGVAGLSVVIHEFVHKLDLLDGEDDGVPPLPVSKRLHWITVLDAAYDRFCNEVELVERSIPIDIDPESEAADHYYAQLAFDPYAATDQAEFFAVSAEAFFTLPGGIADRFPELDALYTAYFGYQPHRNSSHSETQS